MSLWLALLRVQVAMTLWLTTCLLADALAVAAQSLLARHAASGDVRAARLVAERCLALGLGLGGLAALLLAALRCAHRASLNSARLLSCPRDAWRGCRRALASPH